MIHFKNGIACAVLLNLCWTCAPPTVLFTFRCTNPFFNKSDSTSIQTNQYSIFMPQFTEICYKTTVYAV